MSQQPLTMEQLKQILQLKKDGIALREIARRTGVSRNSIKKYLARFEQSFEEQPEVLSNQQIAETAYNNEALLQATERRQALIQHFTYAETELKRTGVTRHLLWLEYKQQHTDGYNYSQYCHHLSQFIKHKDVVMHLEYTAGDMMMIDFAGKKLSYVIMESGELIECEVFVAVLPYSGLIFCKAVHSQNTADFIDCINAMLKFYEGAPLTILCDNLKTAVIRSDRYEPVFTDTCYQLSEHYATTFSATRPYKPRDKAMVERCVNIVYTHLYAPLRNRVFTSLKELNLALAEQLKPLNDKPYKGSAYSRRYFYEQSERATLKQLPSQSFTLKKCVIATVQRNYHIQLTEDHHYYSVPYHYAGKKVKVWYDNKTIEIYLDHNRIALHVRSHITRSYHTIGEHMPSNHQHATDIKGWTKADLLAKANEVGPHTGQVAAHILSGGIYPEQNFKSCHGMLMLYRHYGSNRLEAACARALRATRINYTMVKNILSAGLDKQPPAEDNHPLPGHDNIRGADHYQ
jgi:transposase